MAFNTPEGGEEPFDQRPAPPGNQRTGDAGGLASPNILTAIALTNRHPNAPLCLDMKPNARTGHHPSDLDKAGEVRSQTRENPGIETRLPNKPT